MSGETSNTLQPRAHEPTERGELEDGMDSLWVPIQEGAEETGVTSSTNSHSRTRSQAAQSLAHASSSLRLIRDIAGSIDGADAYLLSRGINVDEMMRTSDRLIQSMTNRSRALEEENRRVNTRLADITRAGGSLDAQDSTAQSTLDDGLSRLADTAQLTLENGISRLADSIRNAELARNNLPTQPQSSQGHEPDGALSVLAQVHAREQAVHRSEHQQDIHDQHHQTTAPRNNPSSNSSTNVPSTSADTTALVLSTTPNGIANAIEQSSTARRDLERALRDYRIVRRAIRSSIDAGSPADQHNPSHQSILAQLTEQQTNNRNRMRARGQSRTYNLIQRHDSVVDRLAAAAGVTNDTWRSDDDEDDNEFMLRANQEALTTAVQNAGNAQALARASTNTLLPIISSSGPYLGPTTSARGSSSMSGGMRDFYRRIEDRDRSAARSSTTSSRVGVPFPEPNTGSGSLRSVNNRVPNQNSALGRFSSIPCPDSGRVGFGKLSYNGSKTRAKKMIKYLSKLREFNNDTERSVQFAKNLGIDSLVENLARQGEIDLPLRIDELPRPPFSSWLEPGMSWTGKQKGGYGKHDTDFSPLVTAGMTSGPLFDDDEGNEGTFRRSRMPTVEERVLQMRAWRHRERVRAERLAANEAGSLLMRESGASSVLGGLNNRLDTLADVERHLTDLLEEEERRQNRDGDDGWRISSASFRPSLNATTSAPETKPVQDEWPVQVTIHEVDWQKMTLSGTMIASQIPHPSQGMGAPATADTTVASTAAAENNNRESRSFTGASMETLFDGEIIDFLNNEFETVTDKTGYRVGGLVTDLKYWSRVGPFKEEGKKRLKAAKDQKAFEFYQKMGIVGTLDQMREEYKRNFKNDRTDHDELDRDEAAGVLFNMMTECLGSRKWVEKTLTGDDGWIFMRWKETERCFISPDPSRPSSLSGPSDSTSESTLTNATPAPAVANTSTINNATANGDAAADANTTNNDNTTANAGTVATTTNTTVHTNNATNASVNGNSDLTMNFFAQTSSMARIRTLVHRPSPTTQAYTYTTSYTDERHPDYAAHNGGHGSWGLTIQGFYYVALHRLSGRIDALYYDSGSQPFQELTCMPVDVAKMAENFGFNKKDESTEFGWMNSVGLRTNFGTFEFR